jgi:hypothetical protein
MVAGMPLAERVADAASARQAASAQEGQAKDAIHAEDAAGVGATDGEEHEAHERDADGRRLWERPLGGGQGHPHEVEAEPDASAHKDPSGELGGELDLCG